MRMGINDWWAIAAPNVPGKKDIFYLSYTISYSRKDAINKYLAMYANKKTWKKAYRRGCRAVRVSVVPMKGSNDGQ